MRITYHVSCQTKFSLPYDYESEQLSKTILNVLVRILQNLPESCILSERLGRKVTPSTSTRNYMRSPKAEIQAIHLVPIPTRREKGIEEDSKNSSTVYDIVFQPEGSHFTRN